MRNGISNTGAVCGSDCAGNVPETGINRTDHLLRDTICTISIDSAARRHYNSPYIGLNAKAMRDSAK